MHVWIGLTWRHSGLSRGENSDNGVEGGKGLREGSGPSWGLMKTSYRKTTWGNQFIKRTNCQTLRHGGPSAVGPFPKDADRILKMIKDVPC